MFVSYTQTQQAPTDCPIVVVISTLVSIAFYEQLKTFYNRQTANYDIILSSLVQLCESNERVEQKSYNKSETIGHFAYTLLPNIVT